MLILQKDGSPCESRPEDASYRYLPVTCKLPLGLVTAGHASLRRPAHRLTIEHHIYRLHMPWIPHPWFGQDENEEARWVPRGAAQRKQCLQ
jgi:hypothetical protein